MEDVADPALAEADVPAGVVVGPQQVAAAELRLDERHVGEAAGDGVVEVPVERPDVGRHAVEPPEREQRHVGVVVADRDLGGGEAIDDRLGMEQARGEPTRIPA
ncbi:MAG: hypothetical protein U0V73_12650 [Acidimicrobiia bacterium]